MTSDAILNGTLAVRFSRGSVGHLFATSLTDANHTRLHIDVIDVGNYAVKRHIWVLIGRVSPSNGVHTLRTPTNHCSLSHNSGSMRLGETDNTEINDMCLDPARDDARRRTKTAITVTKETHEFTAIQEQNTATKA